MLSSSVSWPICVCGHPSFHHPPASDDPDLPPCDTMFCRCEGYWPSGLFTR